MNRRDFIRTLGIAAGSVAMQSLAPGLNVAPATKEWGVPPLADHVYKQSPMFQGYPPLHCTGFKPAHNSVYMCGQLLWGVLYETTDRQEGLVHYYCNVPVDEIGLQQARDPRLYLESRINNGLLKAVQLLDATADLAKQGWVETAEHHQIPNLNYDPGHKATHPPVQQDDDYYMERYCLECEETVNGDNIKLPAKRVKPVSWEDMNSRIIHRVKQPFNYDPPSCFPGQRNFQPTFIEHDYSELWEVEYPYRDSSVTVNQIMMQAAEQGILRDHGA